MSPTNYVQLGDTEQEFSFNNYTEDSGELKSDLPEILGTFADSTNTVSFQRLHEVHGSYEPKSNISATLLVLRVIPKAKGGRPFKYFRVQLTFNNVAGSDPDDEPPSIFAYEPAQQGTQYISEIYTKVTKERNIEESLSAEQFGGGLSISASQKNAEEFQRRKLHTLDAGTDSDKMTSRTQNIVWWELKAAEESNGVGDQLDIAILLKISESTKFAVKAETKAGFVGFSSRDIKLPFQKRKCIEFGPFDPTRGNTQSIPDGVDAKELHAVSTNEVLRKFAHIHIPEKVDPVDYYGHVKSVDSEQTTAKSSSHLPSSQVKNVDQTTTSDLISRNQAKDLPESISAIDINSVNMLSKPKSELRARPEVNPMLSRRAMRHRRMAALYSHLAQLHREEAEEALVLDEADYINQIEQNEATFATG